MALRLLSEEQSALALELLCELAAGERGGEATPAAPGAGGEEDAESVRRRRVREALQRERVLEAQKALLRAAIKEDRKEAVAAAAAPGALPRRCACVRACTQPLTQRLIAAQPSCCRACG